jgi:oxygen-independent coproporphyrinogen-3 oxidase
MIGLRTTWGVDLLNLKEKFNEEILEQFQNDIKLNIEEGILVIENNHLKISDKNWFMADGIASNLFQV